MNQVEVWGDFLLVERGADIGHVEFRAPAAASVPDLHGGDPLLHQWTRQFPNVATAQDSLSTTWEIPSPRQTPGGHAVRRVGVMVDPATDDVVEAQVWLFDEREGDPVTRRSPDVLIYWGRRQRLPRLRVLRSEAERISPFLLRQPDKKIHVGANAGLYVSYTFAPVAADPTIPDRTVLRVRDAVQWTTPDGRYWTVQGMLPPADLMEIANDVSPEAAST